MRPSSSLFPLAASTPLRVAWAALAALSSCASANEAPTPEQLEFFEQKIRPVLADKCFDCHGSEAKSVKGGLLLDSREGWIKGGDTGPGIIPGDPDKSLIIKAIRYTDDEMLMPPKKTGGQLPKAVISDFEKWVAMGAPWPAETKKTKTLAKFDLQERKAARWCWKAPVAQPIPSVQLASWARSDIDRFVLARLEAKGLQPAPAADPATWLRRVHFALVGLPPSPNEVQSFLQDPSPKAREQVVDRLLASPQFGERWARHWMDLFRYAEGRGHEYDYPIPNAWQYRDYLIRTLNADIPYPDFVREHIAGDLLPQPRLHPVTRANESILGTGFWFLGEEVHSPVDIRSDETDRMDNRLDVMSKSFLGLTVTCARCHDHKFDAISQRDYTALTGFLLSSSTRLVRFETIEEERRIAHALEANQNAAQAELRVALARAMRPGIEKTQRYLLAAQDCYHQQPDARGNAAEAVSKAAAAYAQQHQLDPYALEFWLRELREAFLAAQRKAPPTHPLHLFAATTLASRPQAPALLSRTQSIADSLSKTAPDPTEMVTIADYTRPNATPWLQDGFAFGVRPVRAGELLLPATPSDTPLALAPVGAARFHDLWKQIESAGEPDTGRLKDLRRSGQTLRTPEFTLSHGQLWYLVRGAGKAYAAVDSHLIINGPLHGKLITQWKASPTWEWVPHALTDYKGHRVHIELVPDGKQDLEVAMVVESAEKPAPWPATVPSLLGFTPEKAANLESLARLVQTTMQETARRLEQNTHGQDPQTAAWAEWMVRNREMLCPSHSPEGQALQKVIAAWSARAQAIAKTFRPKSQVALAMFEGSGADDFLLRRGSSRSPIAPVPRRFLEALAGPEPMQIASGSGRLQLAEHMVSEQNPFTARVMVNRAWHHLFGRGIVPSVDNFGVLGQDPTHPELLDYLALRFMKEQRWSLKALLRELALTSTYAMSSSPQNPEAESVDPDNLLLHRMNLRRLEGEVIRDAILAVSGRLDLTQGGPSVGVFITPFMEGRGRPASGPLDGNGRRSVYLSIKRNFLSPMMLAFDMPIPFSPMGRRNISNVPAQSLVLMNDPFVVAEARRWAESLPAKAEPSEKIGAMYLRAFGRPPLPQEIADALQFVSEQTAALRGQAKPPGEIHAWSDLCHILLNAKEFIHLN
ncbi:MAG: hypothetical protein RLZZ399_2914 [Verrucomicrobiota bacterium]|jgi:cytochrome c553